MGLWSNIFVRIKGDSTHLDGTLKKTKSSIGAWAGKVMGMFAAAFSIRLVTKLLKKSAELFDIQAKAETSLLIALKGREDIQQSLIKQASELQKVTLFGDEQTIEGAARLAMLLGTDEEAIRRLMPLVQDLAQAKFGGNLVTAADMVAKSVGSSTNALSRYGITIEGAVGSAERLESAIKGMNTQVGGQAQAAAKVGMGSITQLKNAWGDLLEVIGKAIVMSDKFQKLYGGLKKMIEEITEKAAGTYAGMSNEQLKAVKERLEIEREILETKDDELQTENDALTGAKKYNKEARNRRTEIRGIREEWEEIGEQIEKINKLLDYKPSEGSTGDIITGIERVKPIPTTGTGHLKTPSTAGAQKEMTGSASLNEGVGQLRDFNTQLEREMTKMEQILTDARDMAVDFGSQIVESLGEALGGGNIKEIGRGLLMSLANFLLQFGTLLITMGLGMEAFVESLATMNPWIAIAAGAAMLIAAGVIKGLLSKGSKSVTSGATSGSGYSGQSSGYSRGAETGTMKIVVEGKLEGKDIFWSGKRYAQEYDYGT